MDNARAAAGQKQGAASKARQGGGSQGSHACVRQLWQPRIAGLQGGFLPRDSMASGIFGSGCKVAVAVQADMVQNLHTCRHVASALQALLWHTMPLSPCAGAGWGTAGHSAAALPPNSGGRPQGQLSPPAGGRSGHPAAGSSHLGTGQDERGSSWCAAAVGNQTQNRTVSRTPHTVPVGQRTASQHFGFSQDQRAAAV